MTRSFSYRRVLAGTLSGTWQLCYNAAVRPRSPESLMKSAPAGLRVDPGLGACFNDPGDSKCTTRIENTDLIPARDFRGGWCWCLPYANGETEALGRGGRRRGCRAKGHPDWVTGLAAGGGAQEELCPHSGAI